MTGLKECIHVSHRNVNRTDAPQLNADELTVEAVTRWSDSPGFATSFDGIDYSVIARQFLWPIVSAAVRQLRGIPSLEQQLDDFGLRAIDAPHSNVRLKNLRRRAQRWLLQMPSRTLRKWKNRPTILMPFPHHSWKQTHAVIQQTGCVIQTELSLRDHSIRRQLLPEAQKFATAFVEQLTRGLRLFGIDLNDSQQVLLRQQMTSSHANVRMAMATFTRNPKRLLVTNTSATSPTIEYILAAKRHDVPSLAIQYGLDCDRYAYDDVFADYVAVWGEARKKSYIAFSQIQPTSIAVTGSPEHDRPITHVSPRSGVWLWVTRPHSPRRCKLASEDPAAGLKILLTLLRAVERTPGTSLVVKPHPNDYVHLYRRMIEQHSARSRVKLSTSRLHNLFKEADLVLTEDTTAGMDAMWFGCPLIHVRLTDTPPVLPFVEYGAALPGFTESELAESLVLATDQTIISRLRNGQREFLHDFAAVGGGSSASQRLKDFVNPICR